MIPVVLIHHHEITLKGKNRSFFEKKLIANLQKATGLESISQDAARIFIQIAKESDFNQLKSKINSVFGVANFSLAHKVKKDFSEIKKITLQLIKERKFSSFRISARRADKKFPLTSQEINQKLGQAVTQKTKANVSLKNPQLEIFVEIGQKNTYLYFEKIPGPGGLPVSTAGKLLCLLSGGIDSPVAAWQMIKRGAQVDFIHFHSYPQTNQASITKVKKLAQALNRFQFQSQTYLVPLFELQKEFFKNCQHQYLVLLYRRAMFKIAEKIAQEKNYLGLITGESLGQVASQTLENMAVTSQEITLPIYRPLISTDKQEIIALAQKIKTYSLSTQPHQDCCSLFVPKHPATKAKLEKVQEEEAKINLKKLINEISQKVKVVSNQ